MIPTPEFAEQYTNRVIKGHNDFDYFDLAQRTFHNVLLAGPTGSGKTTASKAWASFLQVPFASTEFSRTMDPNSMWGRNRGLGGGETVFDPGDAFIALQGDSVLLLDEVSNLHAGATAFSHGMLDFRGTAFVPQIGRSIKRHAQARIIAAYNPRYAGNLELSVAFRNRFAFTMRWDYDPAVEDARIGAYSPTLLRSVRKMRAEDGVHTDIGTNAMEEFIHIAQNLSLDAAIWLFTNRFTDGERWAVEQHLTAESYRIAEELGL